MMLDITYQKKSGETKTYTILTIDPVKENQYTNTAQLHGILTGDLSDDELVNMIVSLGNLDYNPDDKKVPVANLQSEDAYNNYKALYGGQDRYRTFITENISSVTQILIEEAEDDEDNDNDQDVTTEDDGRVEISQDMKKMTTEGIE
jgi:hypothetical protein